jgi:hypothetical protein
MGIEPTQGKSGSPTATGADATHPLWVAFADGVTGALLKAYDAVVAAGALVLRVQTVDVTGAKQPAGDVHDRAIWHKLTNGTLDALLKLTETAGALGNVVLVTQHQDLAGKVQPAGDDPARPVHVASIGPTTGAETLYAELAGNAASQVALAANAARKKACIVNASTSTGPLWIGEGVTAEANKGTRVDPNGCYNWDSTNPFLGAINVYAAVGVIIGRSEA